MSTVGSLAPTLFPPAALVREMTGGTGGTPDESTDFAGSERGDEAADDTSFSEKEPRGETRPLMRSAAD